MARDPFLFVRLFIQKHRKGRLLKYGYQHRFQPLVNKKLIANANAFEIKCMRTDSVKFIAILFAISPHYTQFIRLLLEKK
jgi:hypothetical protein